MTKSEKALLDRGIHPITGEPLRAFVAPAAGPSTAVPATTLPGWVAEAKAQAAPVWRNLPGDSQATPLPDRPWTFDGVGTATGSGRDTTIFRAPMKNGGTFQATLPGDLVRALLAGKVAGLKRS